MSADRRRLLAGTLKPALRHLRGLGITFGLVARFRGDLAVHARPLTAAFLASLGYTAMRLAEPWPLKVVLDNVLTGNPLTIGISAWDSRFAGNASALLMLSVTAIILVAALRGVFYYQQSVRAAAVGQEVVMDMRRRLFAHLQRLPLAYHSRSSTGDLLTRLTGDILLLRDLLVASLLSVTSELVVVVGFLTIMLLMDPLLAAVALVSLPAVFILVTLYSGRIKSAARQQRKREGQLAGRMHEVLNGIHVVQVFSREDTEDERLRRLNKKSLKTGLKATRLEAQMSRSVEMAIAFTTAATVWIGAVRVLRGELTPGELVVFVSYMRSFHKPLRRLSSVTERASKAATCMERVTDVLDQSSDVPDGNVVADRLRGTIVFEDVSFAYSTERPALRNIDLQVAAGQTVALVGPSGAGKSTLAALVPRLYDPQSGQVSIDGRDVRDYTLASLRSQIAVVPQDGMLFHGTLLDNVAYGRLDATRAEVEEACRAAQIHDFIVSLPDGYDTMIGERGVTLSGGQRQRLAVARALIREAGIVILDEPTTGLDAEAEQAVMAATKRLLAGRTALVIAHRLSTIESADCIVVLEAGRIVERGTHAELIAAGGRYRDLFGLQFAAEDRRRRDDLSRAVG